MGVVRQKQVAPLGFLPLLVAMGACDGSPTDPESTTQTEIVTPGEAVAPSAPFFHGVFLGDAASTPESVGPAVEQFTRLVGGRPALVKTFHRLDSDFATDGWAGRVIEGIDAAGATNMIALDLSLDTADEAFAASYVAEAIAAGAADVRLREIARELGRFGRTVLVEPAWEMNGDWDYAWQGAANGADEAAPARYVRMWRHVVDLFRSEGASNVLWVFSPNVGNPVAGAGVGPAHWNWYGHYYPGADYVDYVGAHGFHAPTLWGGPYTDFRTLFDGAWADYVLTDLSNRFPGKPILIGEFAAEETPDRDKGEWMRDAFRELHAHPRVAGAVWFHMNKEADWRIDSTPSALAAYREAVRNPRTAAVFTHAPGGTLLARK